ncbi:MAG: hypothetical protein FJ279_15905 [Planctomycetes bacterium]|nr:hypothetical protein [Planctomycetota bacterium]
MTARDRFLATLRFESPDRVPYHELGLWGQTVERWIGEGMPPNAVPQSMFYGNEFFGLDKRDFANVAVSMIPAFEPQVLEETERYVVARDARGIVSKAMKIGTVRGTRPSMNQYLGFPVRNRADFEALKKRYDPSTPTRYPKTWAEDVKRWADRDYPLCLLTNGTFGFYSAPRQWMGTENLSVAFYDDPTLMHDILEFLADFFMRTVERAMAEVKFDYFNFFEDLAYKTGPLISPKIFREFMLPRYKRVIEFLRGHGCDLITVDSDGNLEALIPMLLEAGVTGIWPCEIAAGMDPVKLRKEYGQALALSGGIDKRLLARDKRTVEREVMGKLPWLIEQGGFIPTVDHTVPPDVSYQNFLYYLELKRKAAEGRG